MQEWYHGWWRLKRPTKREILEMVRNMQKIKKINEKSKKYHEREKFEAEKCLEKIDIDDK